MVRKPIHRMSAEGLTPQHDELAEGQYPDLHAFTFVTGRNTAHERFTGSVLFIETKS